MKGCAESWCFGGCIPVPRPKGFTLIELLVAVTLIGIIGGAALLSIGSVDRGREQRQEAERLLQLFKLASEEAVIRGAPVAVELFGQGYRFVTDDRGRWNLDIQDPLFRPRSLHPRMHLTLEREGKPVFLDSLESGPPMPHIILTPDGDAALFVVGIRSDDSEEVFSVENTPFEGFVMKSAGDN